MAKKGAKTICFELATPKKGRKSIPTFVHKFGFYDPTENCLADILILKQFISYRANYLETRDRTSAFSHQHFLKHIFLNFMESGIAATEIWLNLWVSASNELGKVWAEVNLSLIVKIIVKGTG